VTRKLNETAAWISIPDFREVCKAVDSEIRVEFGDIFEQRRTLDKAVDYVDALSDPNVQGNSWGISERLGHVNPGPVQSLVGENKWDPREMWRRIAAIAGRLAEEDCENDPLGPGVIVDETAQPKRGMATAGVGYQYAGCAGSVINCTNWVFLTMAGPFMRTWAGCGLYIPGKSWFAGRRETGTARRRSAGIPLGTRFATKPEIARKQFRGLREDGAKFNYATGDEVYGRSDSLRRDHEKHREAYAYFVPRDFRVKVPGKGSMKADDLLGYVDPEFEERSAGPGAKGQRYYEWALIALKSAHHFILVRKPCGQPWGNPPELTGHAPAGTAGNPGEGDRVKDEKITFCLCFIPAGSPIKPTMRNLVLMAGRRWAAEEGNETGKGPVGWDQNQLRKFGSLQKHTALAGLAMLRSNIIMDKLAGRGTVISRQTSPVNGGATPAVDFTEKTEGVRRERNSEAIGKEVMIPLGDSIVPKVAGAGFPAEIGHVRLSRNEVMRLRDAVMNGDSSSKIAFHVECSNWRRRHQAISKWHHHAKRLKAAALASQVSRPGWPPQKATTELGGTKPRSTARRHRKHQESHSMT